MRGLKKTKSTYYLFLTVALTLFSFSPPADNTDPIPQSLPEVHPNALGKATTSIPIRIPRTAGPAPQLALSYSESDEPSLAGQNWDLSGIGFVAADSLGGIHFDGSDRYFSSLHGRLKANGAHLYPAEQVTARYTANPATGSPVEWIAEDGQGITYTFGESLSLLAAEHIPGQPGRIWGLSKVTDLHGNGFTLQYDPESLIDGVLYPAIITAGAVAVELAYEARPEALRQYRHAGNSVQRKRLRTITVKLSGDTVEEYTLEYEFTGGVSRLKRLHREGYEPLTFSYSASAARDSNIAHISAGGRSLNYNYYSRDHWARECPFGEMVCLCTAHAPCLFAFPAAQPICGIYALYFTKTCYEGIERSITFFADVTGDGRADFVRVTGNQKANRLTVDTIQEGGFGGSVSSSFTFEMYKESKILAADVNGDLRTDFIILEQNNAAVKIALATGNPADPFTLVQTAIPVQALYNEENDRHFVADLNGDGRADFIQYAGSFTAYLSTGSSFSASGQPLAIPAYGSSEQQFVDLNGDSRAEYLQISGSTLYTTYFHTDLSVRETTESQLSVSGTRGNRFLTDVNGDGYVDFAVLTAGTLHVALFDGLKFRAATTHPIGHAHVIKPG